MFTSKSRLWLVSAEPSLLREPDTLQSKNGFCTSSLQNHGCDWSVLNLIFCLNRIPCLVKMVSAHFLYKIKAVIGRRCSAAQKNQQV